MHTKVIEKKGSWIQDSETIIIDIESEKYRYQTGKFSDLEIDGIQAKIPTIEPEPENPEGIFDKISLLDRDSTDNFFLKSIR